ncbi:MAG: S-layer homology domain-containing protein [Clostridia bacterium]|nr:S-layer homology domain-containing protein [Clostridia bacterium]
MNKRILSLILTVFIILSVYVPVAANSESVNIAQGKAAFAINSASDTVPSMAVDGDTETAWLSGNGGGYARELMLDLGKAQTINGIRLIPAEDGSAENVTIYGAEVNAYEGKSQIAVVEALGDGNVTVADTETAYRYLVFERAAEETETPFGFAEIEVYSSDEASLDAKNVSLVTTSDKSILISSLADSMDYTRYLESRGVIGANLLDGDRSTATGTTAAKVAPIRMMVNLGTPTKLSHVAYQCASESQDYYNYFKIVATDSYTSAKNIYSEADYDVLAEVTVTPLDGQDNSGLIVFDVPDEFKDNLYSWVGIIKPCASPEQKYTRLSVNTFQAYAPKAAGEEGGEGGEGEGGGEIIPDDGFDLSELSDVAAGKPAFSISSDEGTAPRQALDGDTETYWTAKNFESNSEQLIVDLGNTYTVKGIGILPAFSGSADNMTVYGVSDALFKDKTAILNVETIDTEEMYVEEAASGEYRYIIFERSADAEDADFALAEVAVYVPNAEAENDATSGAVSLMTLNKPIFMSNLANSHDNTSKYNESKKAGFNDDNPTTSAGDATSETVPMRIITDMGMDVKLSHVAVQVKSGSADYGNAFKIVATDSYSSAKDNFSEGHYDVIAQVDTLNRDSKNDSGLVVVEVPEALKDNKYRYVGVIKPHATNLTGAANNFNRLEINTLQAYAQSSEVSDYVAEAGGDHIISGITASVSDSELVINTDILNGENADKLIGIFVRNTDDGVETAYAESTVAHAGAFNSLRISAAVEDGTNGVWEAALIKGREIIKYYENLRKQTERPAYEGENEGAIEYNQIGTSISATVSADCSVMAMVILKPGSDAESFGASDIFAHIIAKSPKNDNSEWKYTFDYTMPSDAAEGEYGIVFATDNADSVLSESSYVFANTDTSTVVRAFENVSEENFARLVRENSGFFGTVTDELLASDTMAKSFMLAKEGFEKGLFAENIKNWNSVEAITAAAKAAIVIDGAFFDNDADITPYIGSMPKVFTDSYDENEFLEILSAVQKNSPVTAKEIANALGRASALCLIADGSIEDVENALKNFSKQLGIKESTLSTKYSMLDIAKKLSNNMTTVKSDYADGMDEEVSDILEDLKNKDKVTSTEKGHSSGGGGGGMSLGGATPVAVPQLTDTADVQKPQSGFSDIVAYGWAEEAITDLSQRGIIAGKGNGFFDPSGTLTREETVKLLILAMELTTDGLGENNYSDCRVGEWYYPFVTAAKVNELVYGVSKQSFGVGMNVTRQDLAVMLSRALAKLGIEYNGDTSEFADSANISDYAKSAVNTLSGLGIITGYTDGSFNPMGNATRAEAAVIFHRFLNIIEK